MANIELEEFSDKQLVSEMLTTSDVIIKLDYDRTEKYY